MCPIDDDNDDDDDDESDCDDTVGNNNMCARVISSIILYIILYRSVFYLFWKNDIVFTKRVRRRFTRRKEVSRVGGRDIPTRAVKPPRGVRPYTYKEKPKIRDVCRVCSACVLV